MYIHNYVCTGYLSRKKMQSYGEFCNITNWSCNIAYSHVSLHRNAGKTQPTSMSILLIQCPNNRSLKPKPVATVNNANVRLVKPSNGLRINTLKCIDIDESSTLVHQMTVKLFVQSLANICGKLRVL